MDLWSVPIHATTVTRPALRVGGDVDRCPVRAPLPPAALDALSSVEPLPPVPAAASLHSLVMPCRGFTWYGDRSGSIWMACSSRPRPSYTRARHSLTRIRSPTGRNSLLLPATGLRAHCCNGDVDALLRMLSCPCIKVCGSRWMPFCNHDARVLAVTDMDDQQECNCTRVMGMPRRKQGR